MADESQFSILAMMTEEKTRRLKITGLQTCSEPLPLKGYTPSLQFITMIFAAKFVNNLCSLMAFLYGLIPFKMDTTGLFSIRCFVRLQPQGFLSARIPTSY